MVKFGQIWEFFLQKSTKVLFLKLYFPILWAFCKEGEVGIIGVACLSTMKEMVFNRKKILIFLNFQMQIVIFEVPAQMLSKFQIYSFCCSGNNTSNFAPTVITNCNIKVGKHTKHVQKIQNGFVQLLVPSICPGPKVSFFFAIFTNQVIHWLLAESHLSQLFTLPQFWSFSCFTMIYDDLQCFTMVYNVSQWFSTIYNVLQWFTMFHSDLQWFTMLTLKCLKIYNFATSCPTAAGGLRAAQCTLALESNTFTIDPPPTIIICSYFCSKLDGCSSFTKYWPFDHNLFHLTFYCQDTLAILGGYIGAVNVPEKW